MSVATFKHASTAISGSKITAAPTSDSATPVHRTFPVSIPISQLYFWSRAWQEAESESVDELASGRKKTFDTAGDAISWLLSPDD